MFRSCRVCGCTEDTACVTEAGACYWVEWELCSACSSEIEEQHKSELQKPPKQQLATADVVMFTGTQGVRTINGTDYPKTMQKGTLGFVNGWRSGVYNTHITTRQISLWVCSLDLKPMRVLEF